LKCATREHIYMGIFLILYPTPLELSYKPIEHLYTLYIEPYTLHPYRCIDILVTTGNYYKLNGGKYLPFSFPSTLKSKP